MLPNEKRAEMNAPEPVTNAKRPAGWFPVRRLQNLGPVAILVLLCLIFEITHSDFLSIPNLATILETAAIPLILSTGLTFVILLGAIDLSLEGIMATSSMVLALSVANNVNTNNWGVFGLIAAVLVGAVFGILNGVLNAYFKMPSLIVTLGTWFIGLGVAAVLFPDRPPMIREQIVNQLTGRIFGLSVIVYLALFAVMVAYFVLRYTNVGRMIYAIGGDERVALASGVPVQRYKIAAFFVSGVLAALCGTLLSAQLSNGNPAIGDGMLFPAISGAVLGGTLLSGGHGGVLQSAVGVLILEVLTIGLIQSGANPYTQTLIQGCVIILAVTLSTWHQRRKLRIIK